MAHAILPPIHWKERYPLLTNIRKYPVRTGGKASGKVAIMFIGKLKYLNLIDKKEKNIEKRKLRRVEITEIFRVIIRALIISIITQPNIHDQQVFVSQNLILRI